MTRDRITQLIQSSNIDDVELAIQFLGSYKIKQIREIIPGGNWNQRKQIYETKLHLRIHYHGVIRYKLSHCLYLVLYSNQMMFYTKPFPFTTYKSLYDKS